MSCRYQRRSPFSYLIYKCFQRGRDVCCEVYPVRPGIRTCGFYSQCVSVQFPMASGGLPG